MKHLADGVLRRMVDEPFAIPTAFRRHYTSCPSCQARFGEVRADAGRTAELLEVPAIAFDPAQGLAEVHARIPAGSSKPGLLRRALHRPLTRPIAGVATAAALVAAVALTPVGSWAQSFVTVFQPTQVAAVPITMSDLQSLRQLSQYGTFQGPGKVQDQHVADAAAASQASGTTVMVPSTLPSGVPSNPNYDVIPGRTASFTFSATKAAQVAAAAGATLPSMPARIDGSTLRVTTGVGVVAVYGAKGDLPALVVGQMKAPEVSSTGVSVTDLEDYVLSLPGISPQLAQSIRAIGNPKTTLPIPVPVNMATAQDVTVQGQHGLAIGDQTGVGSVVVWEKDGTIYGVGGTLARSQAIDIANGLQPAG